METVKIDWLANGEEEWIPRCPSCMSMGPDLNDMSEAREDDTRICINCLTVLEVE